MTDDIVTRLRVATVADSADSIYKSMTEAADEIERLRKAYKDLFQIANHAYCFNNFKVLQDNMKENQKTASELGLYP